MTGTTAQIRTRLRRAIRSLRRRLERPAAGRFQPYRHTLPDRYPWLFAFAAEHLQGRQAPRLLSFGCSRGDEVFALRKYFPAAAIKGIDIDPGNIVHWRARGADVEFAVAATTDGEPAEHYDAIFCLGVLCHGDLTTTGARRSDPLMYFADFERTVTDFARCLKPGGLLLLRATNFRFSDTAIARDFDVVLEAEPAQLSDDALFGRDNRLMPGVRYRPVAFCKRGAAF